MKNKIAFILVLLSAFFIRIFSINWDQGFHLHPDERMLIMVADKINFFKNLNPDFFNYGSLPIYILKGLSQIIDFVFDKKISNYAGMLTVGRGLSVFFDLITIYLIYKIGQLLFKVNKIALFSCFLYAIAFFPIQNSHFFVVDVLLNTFITGLIYTLLVYFKSPSIKKIVVLSFIFAAMLATKFTAIIFLPIILCVIFFKTIKPPFAKATVGRQLSNLTISLATFSFSLLIFYFAFMPFAFIEHTKFISDIKAQLKMNSDPYIFPYTLQYVGTLPYFYYLKNFFLWGLGPIISILSLIGIYNIGKFSIFNFQFSIKSKFLNFKFQILFFIFYFLYFLIIGRSAVKFMRYMLPLYPFFCLLAGYGLYEIYRLKNQMFRIITFTFLLLTLLWTYMFLNIYSFPHTRIAASDWILKNIPEGSTIATEHWDDGIPIYGGEKYLHQELTLYDQPDNDIKWQTLNEKLKKSDYIIIASNRLYVPLQKLSDCTKYKSCYPKTAEYYQKLFSGKLGFKKVSEFSAYPGFKFFDFGFWISDDNADESFTVYDHPKILIFKRK